MRNLLINLTFIFILVLGGASDAFSQDDPSPKTQIGGVDILNIATFDIGGVDILNLKGGKGRVAGENIPQIKVIVSSKEGEVFIEHKEDYTFTYMQITIPQEDIDKLNNGSYLLTVSIEDELVGTKEVLIE